ncbi:unannotated protein [freshwater metagenome]|uniref:Unannotated protein n=1 Tax=freshwater metagenome TaxID=449393 RepID=A0A6J7AP12_9ZZZZ
MPRALRGTSIPFRFNDLAGLTAIMDDDEVGVIYMEVQRNDPPAPGFLEGVRALATKHGAVLVFDECTSGFRRPMGGMHLHYGVDPDIATFGKTLGNGYAINAIIGRTEVMQAAQTTFISSTFWTERIGPTAALAALAAMEQEDAPARVHQIGVNVQQRWQEAATAAGLDITVGGLPALANYTVTGLDPLLVKTYVTKRLLDQGFLGGMSFYASVAHTDAVLDQYFEALDIVMGELAHLDDAALVELLPDGAAQGGFARLT